jgi:hypothetical protein
MSIHVELGKFHPNSLTMILGLIFWVRDEANAESMTEIFNLEGEISLIPHGLTDS